MQELQFRGPRFQSRSGQIPYFHGVKMRLSTLGTSDVPRVSDSEQKIGGRPVRLESPLPVIVWGVSDILKRRLGLHWKLRTR